MRGINAALLSETAALFCKPYCHKGKSEKPVHACVMSTDKIGRVSMRSVLEGFPVHNEAVLTMPCSGMFTTHRLVVDFSKLQSRVDEGVEVGRLQSAQHLSIACTHTSCCDAGYRCVTSLESFAAQPKRDE